MNRYPMKKGKINANNDYYYISHNDAANKKDANKYMYHL